MTSFDIIGAVELTMSAAIVVAALSVLAGHEAVQRIKYSAILSAWFVIVVILSATERWAMHTEPAHRVRNRRDGANRVDVHRADARPSLRSGIHAAHCRFWLEFM